MTDVELMLIWLGLTAFFGGIFGALANTKPAVDLTLRRGVGKMSFEAILAHGHQRPGLDIALLSLIQQKRVSWRFNDRNREQYTGLPPPFQLAHCTFWHTRKRDGIRASPLLAMSGMPL